MTRKRIMIIFIVGIVIVISIGIILFFNLSKDYKKDNSSTDRISSSDNEKIFSVEDIKNDFYLNKEAFNLIKDYFKNKEDYYSIRKKSLIAFNKDLLNAFETIFNDLEYISVQKCPYYIKDDSINDIQSSIEFNRKTVEYQTVTIYYNPEKMLIERAQLTDLGDDWYLGNAFLPD